LSQICKQGKLKILFVLEPYMQSDKKGTETKPKPVRTGVGYVEYCQCLKYLIPGAREREKGEGGKTIQREIR